MDVRLVVVAGRSSMNEVAVPRFPLVIGRKSDCGLRIQSNYVSRRQCQLTLEGERLVLEDLDSANGTLVNNRPVRGAIELKAGDQITIGPITFKIMIDEPVFQWDDSDDSQEENMAETSLPGNDPTRDDIIRIDFKS